MTQLVDPNTTHTVSELIQLSVAPVFLLAAVAGLLNVLIARLTRIIDQVYKIDRREKNDTMTQQLLTKRKFLTMRMSNINLAIFFCTSTGLFVALVILTMFLSTLLHFETSLVISIFFILSMLCLIISLYVFLKEIHYTTSFIKSQQAINKKMVN